MPEQLGLGIGRDDRGAVISACGNYRYHLWREWDANKGSVLWCMLNPSKADAFVDDPTIKKCCGFAQRWGFGRIDVVNLYAFRATDPSQLQDAGRIGNIVGPENDVWIAERSAKSHIAVVAWGNSLPLKVRADRSLYVYDLLRLRAGARQIRCLGTTQDGQPLHPVRIGYDTPLVAFVRVIKGGADG